MLLVHGAIMMASRSSRSLTLLSHRLRRVNVGPTNTAARTFLSHILFNGRCIIHPFSLTHFVAQYACGNNEIFHEHLITHP
jgi:hypothetical protein